MQNFQKEALPSKKEYLRSVDCPEGGWQNMGFSGSSDTAYVYNKHKKEITHEAVHNPKIDKVLKDANFKDLSLDKIQAALDIAEGNTAAKARELLAAAKENGASESDTLAEFTTKLRHANKTIA